MRSAPPTLGAPWLSVLTAVLLVGCATAQVQLEPRVVASLERTLPGEQRFLRVSMYQTPFFGDGTKKLLTPVAPELVRLLDDPQGKPIAPGRVERVWPAGTAARVLSVEFPTAVVMSQRVLYTPRSLVWLTVQLEGQPANAAPLVLVLRPGLSSEPELQTELERLLSREAQTRRLERFTDSAREAIRTKTAVREMPAEALEMAWGYPERKKIELEGAQRKETWRWPDDLRRAVLVDGRVTDFTGASGASSASSP